MNPMSSQPTMPDDAPRSPDAPRRVVVVRDEALAKRLEQRFSQQVEVVLLPGVLSAMADAMHHGASRIVVSGEALRGIERSGLETFSKAGVEARGGMVIVEADTEQAELFVQAGVTRFATHGDDDQAWQEVLGLEPSEPPKPGEPGETLAAPTPSANAPTEQVEHTEQAEPFLAALPLEPDNEAALLELGDSDLVEAILEIGAEGGRRAPLLAVALAQQQSGIAGLAFAVKDRAEVPADHAAAEAAYHGRSYGHLHAPAPATAEQLQPWAAWLARWVELEQQTRQLRDLAMKDELTGVWNRRYFNRFLRRILERATVGRQQVTLLVFDIDNFKSYNDTHGHAAGDDILKGAAQLMQTVVRDHDVVARIGGDEFAVIFWDAAGPREEGSSHPDGVLNIAKRFQKAVCELKFPALARADMDTLTISGGLAGFPWDGRTPEDLLHHADMMAIESKKKGKNAITFGSGATRCELPRGDA